MKKLKLSKKFQNRKRLIRNLLSSLILFESVKTTAPKAKALKAEAASFIAKIKTMKDEVNTKRFINSYLYGGARIKAYDYKDKFQEIKSYKLGNRFGDNAEQVMVVLTVQEAEKSNKAKSK